MRRPDQPAFPTVDAFRTPWPGLSRRDAAAFGIAAALAPVFASSASPGWVDVAAEEAVRLADALLKKLSPEEESQAG